MRCERCKQKRATFYVLNTALCRECTAIVLAQLYHDIPHKGRRKILGDRIEEVISYIRKAKVVSSAELADKFNVSQPTAICWLKYLSKFHIVQKNGRRWCYVRPNKSCFGISRYPG